MAMTERMGVVELGFVTAKDVQRYAENSLPKEDHELIEQALLDDERTRELVIKKAGHGDVPPPSEPTSQKLVSSFDACRQCLVGYESMKSADGPGRLLDFAADRFVKRGDLLKQVWKVLSDRDSTRETVNDSGGDDGQPHSDVNLAIEQALQQDSALIGTLREAFYAASAPIWKARIAGWIAAIDDDVFRLVRLQRAYS